MAKYLDTGASGPDQFVGAWLEQNLLQDIREFRAQFGYFRFSAVEPFAANLRDAAGANRPVHFVLGSNDGSLVAQDAQLVYFTARGGNSSLVVVAFDGAEFHPKTIHIVRADGTATAIVGSSNLTGRGLGKNVEASAVFDTAAYDDPAVLAAIARATDRWREAEGAGVFRIRGNADIQRLADKGIINLPQPKKRVRAAGGAGAHANAGSGEREAVWTPARGGWRPDIPGLIARPGRIVVDLTPVPAPPAPPLPPAPQPAFPPAPAAGFTDIWQSKGLTERDLSIPRSPGTHPTGSMLWKKGAAVNIDQRHWFRDVAFDGLNWTPDTEEPHLHRATARFEIVTDGVSRGAFELRLTHNTNTLSRAYEQKNSMTQIHWGDAKPLVARRPYLGRIMHLYRKEGNPPEYRIEIA